jgi:cell division protein FtsN
MSVSTKAGLFAEMRAILTISAVISDLERNAPESRVLVELREAERVAHPACFQERNNEALHAEFRAAHGGRSPAGAAKVDAPRAEPSQVVESVAQGLSPTDLAKLRALLAAVPEAAVQQPAQQPAQQPVMHAPATGASVVPPVVPGDQDTTRVG